MGKGGRFAACAFLAAAEEFPFNKRINVRDQQKGKKKRREMRKLHDAVI